MSEASYFFKMGKHQEWLIQYIQDNPAFVQVYMLHTLPLLVLVLVLVVLRTYLMITLPYSDTNSDCVGNYCCSGCHSLVILLLPL
jgi:hypothetical protein